MAPATNSRLPGRQTNNSLSSLTENLFIPPGGSTGKTKNIGKTAKPQDAHKKKKVKSSEM